MRVPQESSESPTCKLEGNRLTPVCMREFLNPQQREAVHHKEGPLLVLAGAGSGKTRVVTERCAELLRSGVDPSEILGLTFTNQAAGEMKERIALEHLRSPFIGTFHSFGARVLRESSEAIGFSRHFVIYDEEDSLKVVKAVMATLGLEDKKGVARELRALISAKKNRLDFDEKESDPAFHLYQEKLKSFQALDFDDLLFLTVKLFQEAPGVLERYQRRFRYVMVDEYQDTNQAQYLMLKLLVEKTKNLFVVGDPDQSIYSWRGANIGNILHFERDYPGAKVIRLEQNYRSTETILNAANALIEHNQSRYEKRLWSQLGEGERIEVKELFTEREEARFVADKVESFTKRGVPLSEIVVFYRTNAQSRAFEDQFIAWGIPYRIVGGLSFYQRREIKDILAYLRVVLCPSDYISISRTINLPKRGVGEATLEKLQEGSKLSNIAFLNYLKETSIKLSKSAKEGLREYRELIEELSQAVQTQKISEVVKLTIEKSRYLDYLKEDPETYLDRKNNLDELISKAKEFEGNGEGATLSAFLEELSLKSSADEGFESPHTVSLMTVHNGKGLEFQAVFLVGMEEGLFPHINSLEDPDAVEEERRLCYVGMTRAKQFLTLSGCTFRYIWGTERTSRPSRFIREFSPGKLHEKVDKIF